MDIEAYLRANWTKARVADMAIHVGMQEQQVRRLAIKLKLGPRPERKSSQSDPSRAEIKKRAAEVRSQWTREERLRREVGPRARRAWSLPLIQVGEIEAPSFSRM